MCEDEGEGEGEGQPRPGEAREDVRSANPNLRPNPRPDPDPRPNLTLTLVLSLALTLVLTLTRSDAKPICCFNCGGTGHKSKDCPEARDTNQACSQFFSPSAGPDPGPGPSPCSTPIAKLNHGFFTLDYNPDPNADLNPNLSRYASSSSRQAPAREETPAASPM